MFDAASASNGLVMNAHVERAQGSINRSRENPAPSSTSVRVGHLVMRAMAFFESNREVAWRCLKDASTLLSGEPESIGINVAPSQGNWQRGSLAAWQARRAVEYIEDHLGLRMRVRDMAALVALSPSHFSRAFKQSLGSSPMAYVAARRVERAKLMMTSTRERLANIALECGFADQAHFNKSFRRFLGMSPGLWRRSSIAQGVEERGLGRCELRTMPDRHHFYFEI